MTIITDYRGINIPSLPNDKFIGEDGDITPSWRNHLDQLTRQLQTYFNRFGHNLPQQTTTTLTAVMPNNPNGSMIYDTSVDAAKIIIAGTYKTIQVS